MEAAERRFHTLIVGLIVPAIVLGIVKLAPWLAQLSTLQLAGTVAGAALLSAGVYRGLTSLLNSVLREVEFVKKRFLGPAYLNGTWVGCYQASSGHVAYVVEFVEQTLTTIVTRGTSFNANGSERGSWTSQAIFLDASKGLFVYTCKAKFSSVGRPSDTLVEFMLNREERKSAPKALSGTVTDTHDGYMTTLRVVKAADKFIRTEDALRIARDACTIELPSDREAPTA